MRAYFFLSPVSTSTPLVQTSKSDPCSFFTATSYPTAPHSRSQSRIVCNCQFQETDKSAPATDYALVLFPFPLTLTLRILLTICGVSMLQIFEPFSLCLSAYTGKLNKQQADCASWQYYTLSEQKLHSLKPPFLWPSRVHILTTRSRLKLVSIYCVLNLARHQDYRDVKDPTCKICDLSFFY